MDEYPVTRPDDERLVVSVAEAGALLGISRAFAYELVARGELPVICLGRRRLVPKAALLTLVGASNSRQSLPEPVEGAVPPNAVSQSTPAPPKPRAHF